ncbi:hypothetical protein SDC9_95835 [bioreactor metagenome]|uniref:Uncharacterized protein n=1 Tax=bioreactor metagenome TaxID=1076179 RepID=A0A645A7Q8_9ZZZZ
MFQSVETETGDQALALRLFDARVPLPRKPRVDVLQHRHVRKQRIPLEEISHPALLRRQVDLFSGVVEHAPVQHDPAFIRLLHARDAP